MNILYILQFIPLTSFLWYAKAHALADYAWPAAFYLGASVAAVQLILFFLTKTHLNLFITAVNLFLIGGATAFLTQNSYLLYAYGSLQATMLFVCLLIVGFVAVAFPPPCEPTFNSVTLRYSFVSPVI